MKVPTMQRQTKYRLAIGTLAITTTALAAFGVAMSRQCVQLRDDAAQAAQRASDGAKKLLAAEQAMKTQAATHQAELAPLRQALAAFSHQAEVCTALKQQLHLKE